MAAQTTYNRHHDAFRVGMVSKPLPETEFISGAVAVATGAEAPRPGDAVWYDPADDKFKLPTDLLKAVEAIGIIATPSHAVGGSDGTFAHKDGDIIRVMICGTMAVRAGGATQFGNAVFFNHAALDDHEWLEHVPATITSANLYPKNPAIVVTKGSVADATIFEVRLNGPTRGLLA